MTEPLRRASVPEMPPPQELEAVAALAVANPQGCWWVTVQASVHLLNAAARRDAHSGELLPQPLGELLGGIARQANVVRPLPADTIQFAAEFLAEPLRHILHHGRSKIVREHVLQPPHRLREMDAACVNWLGRMPGRTVREKLAGRTSALGVVRAFSLDTHENRVVRRVAQVLGDWIAWRLEAITTGAYDEDAAVRGTLELCHELCVEDFPSSPLASVPLSLTPEANNVLLRDRNYSRVWRAWLSLRGLLAELPWLWRDCEARFRTAFFWALAAELAGTPGACLADGLSRVIPGPAGAAFGLELLEVVDDRVTWSRLTAITFVLEPMLSSATHLQGTITRIAENERRPFGFIRGDDGKRYFLHPTALLGALTWEELKEQMRVAFRPGAPRARARGVREQAPPAEEVGFATGAALLRLSVVEGGMEAHHVPLHGERLLYPAAELARTVRYHLQLEPTRLRPRRGVGLSFEVVEGRSVRLRQVETADLGGIRSLLRAIVAEFVPGPPVHRAKQPRTDYSGAQSASRIGLDLGAVRPLASLNGCVAELSSLLYAVQYPIDSEGTLEWVCGQAGRWPEVLGTQCDLCALADLFGAPTVHQRAGEAAQRMFEQVRDEVAASNAGPLGRCAYAVPDSVDEWSQYVIRSAANAAVRGSLPVWRSVCAALGWQGTADFRNGNVRPGDVVIVVDATGTGLDATFLIACYDEELCRRLPDTQGIFWERRACLIPAALPEELGAEAAALTFEALQASFLASSLSSTEEAARIPDDWQAFFLDRLVRTGAAERIVQDRLPAWFPLGTREVTTVLHVPAEPVVCAAAARGWGERLRGFLVELAGNELFKELLHGALRGDRDAYILFAGAPFHLPEVRTAVTSIPLLGELRQFHLVARPDAHRLVATGTGNFLVRLEGNLPSWRDWLPELYLEVIRDGHFHELQLMAEYLLVGEATVASLGKAFTVTVGEKLLLPEGRKSYDFPLFVGRRRDRLQYDAVLRADAFPLAHPLEVRLELSYRYGLETAYELCVIASDASAPFEHLSVTWTRRGDTAHTETGAAAAPHFPVPRSWNDAALEELRIWLVEKSTDVVDKFGLFFGGAAVNERPLERFAQGIVSGWNRNRRPGASPWATPHSPSDTRMVFAEWLRRAVEVPLRRLWDEGRELGSAPAELRGAVTAAFLPWLSHLARLDEHPNWPAPGDDLYDDGWAAIQGTAVLLLARLHADAPEGLAALTAERLVEAYEQGVRIGPAAMSVAHAAGDGEGFRAVALRTLLELASEAIERGRAHPLAQSELLRALRTALWRHPRCVHALAIVDPRFLRWFPDWMERDFRGTELRLGQSPDRRLVENLGRRFAYSCEVLLALLRLREQSEHAELLRPGGARSFRLAWLIRTLDRRFCELSVGVRSAIRFDAGKPPSLSRMSEIAFAANCFLTGESGSNRIQICSIEDDEEGDA